MRYRILKNRETELNSVQYNSGQYSKRSRVQHDAEWKYDGNSSKRIDHFIIRVPCDSEFDIIICLRYVLMMSKK